MKKIHVIAIFCLLLLVGCRNYDEKSSSEQNYDGAKWSKSRSNLFSSMDYPELSKTEAEKLMEEKFDLAMPSFFEESLALTKKLLKMESQAQYTIKSEAEILTIRGIVTREETSSSHYVGLAEAQFQVNQQKQKVYLTKQSIVIQNSDLQGEPIRSLVRKVGEAMELPDLAQVMEHAEKKIAQAKEQELNQVIEIYNDSEMAQKQQEVSHILTISFNENRLVKEIYGLMSIE